MTKTCKQCSGQFNVDQTDQEFYARVHAPLPRRCPKCRLQTRLAYRNERALFSGTCGLCKKSIVTIYNPADNFVVYCQECWWKDSWTATDYGQDIDWHRPLLEQYDEVRQRVPRLSLVNMNSENSAFTNMSDGNKNCYLIFAAEQNDNCSYGKLVQSCKDCFDNSFLYDSELCYECINVRHCYHSIFLQDCQDSQDCGYSIGLKGCSNVFLSSNLYNKHYYIANQPVKPEDYAQRVAELTKDTAARQACYEAWRKLNAGRIVKYSNLIKSDGCTGDNLADCKRVYDSFDLSSGQDCRYCTDALTPKDSYDCSFFYYNPELCYDSLSMLQTYNVQYSTFVFYTHDAQYLDQVYNSSNVMLSSCLRGKQHVILNKQYSEAEYNELLPKVIAKMQADGEYGELPGLQHSLFAYNDTVAQEYFPLTATEAKKLGLRWNSGAADAATKPFKLTKAEQDFYTLMKLPEPIEHPDARHNRRMALRNPRKLWKRSCQNAGCKNIFMTTYQAERPELVYCESCFSKVMY